MSAVTRWMVSWIVRRKARPDAERSAGRAPVAVEQGLRCVWKKRHTRLRKRKAPSTPWSLQSRSFSGGATKS